MATCCRQRLPSRAAICCAWPLTRCPIPPISVCCAHRRPKYAEAFAVADAAAIPTVVFAYTIKGWGLPIEGDPMNHSALLTAAQMDLLRVACGIGEEDRFPAFAPNSVEGRVCAAAAERLRVEPRQDADPAAFAARIP